MDSRRVNSLQPLLPQFGEGFLSDHAGSIIRDPQVAIVELVANCWDAGADRVDIEWYPGGRYFLAIEDNGTGMTTEEFSQRRVELSYNRREAQGPDVEFPPGNIQSRRRVFGQNGKGRHGMFCFTHEYFVETRKNGILSRFRVERVFRRAQTPFKVTLEEVTTTEAGEHGTRIWAEVWEPQISEPNLRDLLGSKFISDPSFKIFVNSDEVELTDLSHLFERHEVSVNGLDPIEILLFDTEKASRTTKQHGAAWWVNKRLVGEPSWKKLNGESYLDGRLANAKRYTFVIMADVLQDHVREDWRGFRKHPVVEEAAEAVEDLITNRLHRLFQSTYKQRKQDALENNRDTLLVLPPASRRQIGRFLDEIQEKSPSIRVDQLNDAVEVLAKLEQSRSGYALLQQLARLHPDDLDGLHRILSSWSVQEAQTVLDELHKRLKLIQQLERIVEDPNADELHEIQPLFERGLWIFGPEYESVEFTSNRSLATVVKSLFKDFSVAISTPRRRPDLIALPDSSIGIYSCDRYDERGEVNGIGRVLIVELKRGGFELSRQEVRQAEDYEIEIRKSGKISVETKVTAFVLGAKLGEDARAPITKADNTFIYPRTYSTVLRQAHARTFNLQEKIQRTSGTDLFDPDVERVVNGTALQQEFSTFR